MRLSFAMVLLLVLPACRTWVHQAVDAAAQCPIIDSFAPEPEFDWSTVDESRWDPTGVPLYARMGAIESWQLGRKARHLLSSGVNIGDISVRLSDSRTLVAVLDQHSLLVVFCRPTAVLEGVRVWVVKI